MGGYDFILFSQSASTMDKLFKRGYLEREKNNNYYYYKLLEKPIIERNMKLRTKETHKSRQNQHINSKEN